MVMAHVGGADCRGPTYGIDCRWNHFAELMLARNTTASDVTKPQYKLGNNFSENQSELELQEESRRYYLLCKSTRRTLYKQLVTW